MRGLKLDMFVARFNICWSNKENCFSQIRTSFWHFPSSFRCICSYFWAFRT